jgi:peptidoglycan/xylan/chitin deacetylase (PgdA/CDA1 family)
LEYISWTIRTRDTLTSHPEVLARRILDQAASGDIILLHDRLPHGAQVMLETLPRVIDELRNRGFEFVLAGPREDTGAATPEPLVSESAH